MEYIVNEKSAGPYYLVVLQPGSFYSTWFQHTNRLSEITSVQGYVIDLWIDAGGGLVSSCLTPHPQSKAPTRLWVSDGGGHMPVVSSSERFI